MTTKILAGLGNPGKKYELTKHNAGFLFLDYLEVKLHKLGAEIISSEKSFKDDLFTYSELHYKNIKFILVKPQTFMNLSGKALVQAKREFFVKGNSDVIVAVDELDLPLGSSKFALEKYSKSHNGMISVAEHIGKGFYTLRFGIDNNNRAEIPGEEYVLKPFATHELLLLEQSFVKATEELTKQVISA